MKQIYKRQPIQHTLPSNYDDLDAVSYLNLNNFKGLQVYDNPLVAEYNSTYSCKNVYVDEHRNLTVRPALTPVSPVPQYFYDWEYIFSDNTVLGYNDLDSVRQLFWGNNTVYVSSSVIPVEFNDKKYVFVQDATKLHNILYELTTDGFVQIEGSILLDDPTNTDISHYNILNDLVKYEYGGRDLSNIRPATDYDIVYKVPFDLRWDKPYKIQPLSDDIIVIAGQNKIIIIYKKQFITLTVDTGYQRNSNDWCITFTNDVFDITVACLDIDPLESNDIPSSNSVGAYFKSGRVKRFKISTTGRILSEYTADIAGAGLFAGYGYAIILCANTVTDTYGNYEYELYTRELTDNFAFDHVNNLTDWQEIELPETLYPVIRTAASTKVGYYGYVVAFGEGLAYICRQKYANTQVHKVYFRTYNGTLFSNISDGHYIASGTSAASATPFYSIFNDKIISEYNHIYFLEQNYISSELLRYAKIFEISNEAGLKYINKLDINMPCVVTILSPTASYGVSNNSVFEHGYAADTPNEYQFDIVPVFASDTMAITTDSAFVYRVPKLLSTILPRDTSIIPVISSINERVITGFFLDNCWWFITEHSIFGTGIDSNGAPTPERFDPLKYFKVSEKITGAMRISDTSFWVFHNNGAYLIYKTSLALADGTEYRWLYTTTAKSKGCDFENALITLPISSTIATVTASDICTVQLRENVQSDERILVPITTQFSVLLRDLLTTAESVKIWNYEYLTLFALNQRRDTVSDTDTTPVIVFDNVTSSWWYWEFPVTEVYSVQSFEKDTILHCRIGHQMRYLKLTDDSYNYRIGDIEWEIYADRLNHVSQDFTQIEWKWQSAVQICNAVERRKQLLFTTFIFDNYDTDGQDIEIGYCFDIYSKQYFSGIPDTTTSTIYRVSNQACRTLIGSFNYLQLNLYNREYEDLQFEVLSKPKICCISMKYRILRGEI